MRATRQRTWPAVLTLLLLPGLTAEALTGSTPILVYLTNPVSFISNTLLYGGGALLIRELVRRRRLGWTSILLLGGAYGIFEEGLVVNTWANPWLPQVCTIIRGRATGICNYSRVGGINLSWAASLTVFHAVVSITIPILLVELVFSGRAALPWLGRKLTIALICGELLILGAGLFLNVYSFRQHHLAGPPAGPYLVEVGLMIILGALALSRTPAAETPPYYMPHLPEVKTAPHLWTLRIFGFVGLLVNTVLASLCQGARIPFPAELVANAVLLLAAGWRVFAWSRRRGWGQQHRLALASGALGFFIIFWAPILELVGSAGGNSTRGSAVWALIYLIFLLVLARRVGRHPRGQADPAGFPPLTAAPVSAGRESAPPARRE
jgi:hypothetical protein